MPPSWKTQQIFAAALGLVLFPFPAFSSGTIELQPITVSALRHETLSGRVAENVIGVSAKTIARMPARDLGDVLARIPGVDVSVGSKMAQPTSMTIHGSNSRDVLLMVDDIPFNTQLSGQANPSRLPIENARRIEVIKGAASSAWGSSLGGVINVITKDVGDSVMPHGRVTTSWAKYATRKQSVELAGKAGMAGYLITGSYLTTEGIREYSDALEKKIFNKVAVPIGDQAKLTASFGYSGGQIEDGIVPTNKINKTPYASRYGKLKLDLEKEFAEMNIAYKYNDQDTTTDSYSAVTGLLIGSPTINHNKYHGIGVNSVVHLRDSDVLSVGSDFDWHTIKSNNYLSKSETVNIQAPYANYTWRTDHWDIIPGLRFDNNNRFGSQLSPSLGGVYHLNDDYATEIKAKFSQAFGAPPLMWILNNDPVLKIIPNQDLRAEHAFVYEGGISTRIDRLGFGVNVYRSDVTDGLTYIRNSSTGMSRAENVSKIRRQGVEGDINYKLTEELKLTMAAGFNHAVNRATRKVIRGNGTARHSFRGSLEFMHPKGFGAAIYGHYERWDSAPDQANDRKPIFDLRLTKAWKSVYKNLDVEVFLDINNVTNSRYWASPTKPLARRYFESGVTVGF